MAAQQAPEGAAALTPDVKQMIADEVKAQIALTNDEAKQIAANQDVDPGSSGIARLLADNKPHVFVAAGALDVVDSSGAECALSDGDVLKLMAPPGPSATDANLMVLSSKGGLECRKSTVVTVALTDLQDMQNHMRETIDQGLQELQEKQGQGGLPAAPPSAMAAPTIRPSRKALHPRTQCRCRDQPTAKGRTDLAEQDVLAQAQMEARAARQSGCCPEDDRDLARPTTK